MERGAWRAQLPVLGKQAGLPGPYLDAAGHQQLCKTLSLGKFVVLLLACPSFAMRVIVTYEEQQLTRHPVFAAHARFLSSWSNPCRLSKLMIYLLSHPFLATTFHSTGGQQATYCLFPLASLHPTEIEDVWREWIWSQHLGARARFREMFLSRNFVPLVFIMNIYLNAFLVKANWIEAAIPALFSFIVPAIRRRPLPID
eukprot:1140769-Pelagomonas_calceolata.AAC.9